jgi:hypothetical protein
MSGRRAHRKIGFAVAGLLVLNPPGTLPARDTHYPGCRAVAMAPERRA